LDSRAQRISLLGPFHGVRASWSAVVSLPIPLR